MQIIYQNDRREELIKINLLLAFLGPPGGASEHLKVAKMPKNAHSHYGLTDWTFADGSNIVQKFNRASPCDARIEKQKFQTGQNWPILAIF